MRHSVQRSQRAGGGANSSIKGGGLSVIIAGATGNTGSELVSRLASHKSVSRIVALTRRDISVDKWQQYFPNLRTTDALKFLSVVAVDWDRIHRDASSIPAAALCTKPSLVDEGRPFLTMKGARLSQQANDHSSPSSPTLAVEDTFDDESGPTSRYHGRRRSQMTTLDSSRTFRVATVGDQQFESYPFVSPAATFPSSSSFAALSDGAEGDATLMGEEEGGGGGGVRSLPRASNVSIPSELGILSPNGPSVRTRLQRLRKEEVTAAARDERRRTLRKRIASLWQSSGPSTVGNSNDNDDEKNNNQNYGDSATTKVAGGALDGEGDVDPEHLISPQERDAIVALCQDPFYRSVFAGHTIAINCLGTHRVLVGSRVTTVDLEYSLAFAKLVRLFNGVTINDAFLQDVTCDVSASFDGGNQEERQSHEGKKDVFTLRAPRGSRRSMAKEGSAVWSEIRSACFGQIANVTLGGGSEGRADFNNNSTMNKSLTPAPPHTVSAVGVGAVHRHHEVTGSSAADTALGDKEALSQGQELDDTEQALSFAPFNTAPPTLTVLLNSSSDVDKANKITTSAQMRRKAYESRKADLARVKAWDLAIGKALRGRRHSSHTLQHFVQVSSAGAHEHSILPYFRVHGMCDKRVLALFDFDECSGAPSQPNERQGVDADESDRNGKVIRLLPPKPRVSASRPGEPVRGVPLLAPLSMLAPTFNHRADVTVFRPGVLKRKKATRLERFLGYWSPPLEVGEFANVIIDDIMARQQLVDDGLEAFSELQLALNRKYKYKVWVTQEVITTTNDPPLPHPNSTPSLTPSQTWDEESLRALGISSANSFYGGLHTSESSSTVSSNTFSSSVKKKSTPSVATPPQTSRAKIMAQIAQEKAELKARLGVSKTDLERMDEDTGIDAASPESSANLSYSNSSTPTHQHSCAVCDLRAWLGIDPSATIVHPTDIKRRHERLVGMRRQRQTEEGATNPTNNIQVQAMRRKSQGGRSGSGWYQSLFSPLKEEPLCHQR